MHQQREYVANTSVNFSDFRFFVKPGDLCRHLEDTGDFIIFRNGALLAKLRISTMALRNMMTPETKFFTEIKSISVSDLPKLTEPESGPHIVVIEEEAEKEEVIVINDSIPPIKDEIVSITNDTPLLDEQLEEEVDEESTDEAGTVTIVKKKRKK